MFDAYQSLHEFENSSTPEERGERIRRESEERLEIKKLLTVVSKYRLEDVTNVKKEYLQCTQKCYDKVEVDKLDAEEVHNLSYCKNECKAPMKDLYAFFDNINFLSEEKMKNCMDKCDKLRATRIENPDALLENFNNCTWMCYNKLERRYRGYWKEKRDKIVQRHLYKNFDE